jgi:hypothetical protein
MRSNRKLAGLLLLLLICAVGSVMWCERDRTGEPSTATAANSSLGAPIASRAASGADTEAPTRAAPPSELPAGGVVQGTSGEASKPVAVAGVKATRGGTKPKAPWASNAKRMAAEPQDRAPAVAQRQEESSDRRDAGTREEPPPEAAQPPRQEGTLVVRFI